MIYFLIGDSPAVSDRICAVSDETDAVQFCRLVNLADCAAILSLNPTSVCNLAEINLGYIRDAFPNGILALIDDSANFYGVGTENSGNVQIPP